MKEKGRG